MRFKFPMHKFVVIDGRPKISARLEEAGDEHAIHHFQLVQRLAPDTESIPWERTALGWILGSGPVREVALQQEATHEMADMVRRGLRAWCRRNAVTGLEFVASPFVGDEDQYSSRSVLAENVRRLLGMHELSLLEAGNLLSPPLTPQALSLLINERRGASASTLRRLAELFELAPERLQTARFADLLTTELASSDRFLRVEARIQSERQTSSEDPKTRRVGKARKEQAPVSSERRSP